MRNTTNPIKVLKFMLPFIFTEKVTVILIGTGLTGNFYESSLIRFTSHSLPFDVKASMLLAHK